jgi:hypothetical protein
MAGEALDLARPPVFASQEERHAAVAFFNAAYRAEEAGLHQAHTLAGEIERDDPELAECLRLYGDEEGWHRSLLTEFLGWLGGGIRPMGRTTRTFYWAYGQARRMESVILLNLMFETIGSTTYRIALAADHQPAVRQMLSILVRDESFHVPLNVHFLRHALARAPAARRRLQWLYTATFTALVASTAASRPRAGRFDGIPAGVLARAYVEELARLVVEQPDLGLAAPRLLVRVFGKDEPPPWNRTKVRDRFS